MEEQCTFYLEKLSLFLSTYKWLLDSFIIEFFVEDHWSQLPATWKESLRASDDDSLSEIARLIFSDHDSAPIKRVFPLSLLSFAATCRAFSFVKSPQSVGGGSDSLRRPRSPLGRSQVDGLSHSFRRHVKPKKQHEIKHLGKVISEVCRQVKCPNVIDIGSGQGHLARYLAFHHGLRVTAVEAVGHHLTAAAKFDRKVQMDLDKQDGMLVPSRAGGRSTVRHVEATVECDTSATQLLSQIGLGDSPAPSAPPTIEEGEGFVLTGLHPCGDLSATMLRVFARSKQLVGVVCVGCCYMKLTTGPSPSGGVADTLDTDVVQGYPMSRFLRGCGHTLSYEARELACHSIATYTDRFKGIGGFEHLKVHPYRAAVEILLRKKGLRRSQVRIAKRVSKLPFLSYAQKLLESVLSTTPLSWSQADLRDLQRVMEGEWRSVVVLFLLRLAMAPAVEAAILVDRKLFLLEQGYRNTHLFPVFDARISPRNMVLLAKQ